MLRTLLQKSVVLVPWQARRWVKQIPLLAPLQRTLLSKALAGRQFLHVIDGGPARGLNYPICLPDDKNIWTGTYELEFSAQLARAVTPGAVCLDVGGWRGFFSGVMAIAGASRVIVFEPLPENCEQIRTVIKLNPSLPIELIEAAVGEKEEKMKFSVTGATSMGKLVGSPFQSENNIGTEIEVQVVSLDEFLSRQRVASPQVIKIDVEGAELFVLRGAIRTLRDSKPKLFVEIHSRELGRDCHYLLQSLGYRVSVLETGRMPDGNLEPEICHFIARGSNLAT